MASLKEFKISISIFSGLKLFLEISYKFFKKFEKNFQEEIFPGIYYLFPWKYFQKYFH